MLISALNTARGLDIFKHLYLKREYLKICGTPTYHKNSKVFRNPNIYFFHKTLLHAPKVSDDIHAKNFREPTFAKT